MCPRKVARQIKKHISIITMRVVTKLVRVIKYCKGLPPWNLHDASMRWFLRPADKLNTLYLKLQNTHEHQTRPCADLPKDNYIRKATWPINQIINVKPCDNLKNLYLYSCKAYGHNLARCRLRGGGSARKCLGCHQFLTFCYTEQVFLKLTWKRGWFKVSKTLKT